MGTDVTPPLVSIVIVAFHSHADLVRLLPTLYRQELQDFELLIVNNDENDRELGLLEYSYPRLRVVQAKGNLGYAGGNNVGLREARGRYVLVLNPDTELQPGCLSRLLETISSNPKAIVNPKILLQGGSIYACGLQMHYTGITTRRGQGKAATEYMGTFEVPILSGTALIASREVWAMLGGFDEDFFMYHEDTDLSIRARLSGFPLLCEGEAVLTHHCRLGIDSPDKFYLLERNRLLMLLKNFRRPTLVRLVPALVLTEIATWCFALLRGPAYLRSRFSGYVWLWENRKELGAKRRKNLVHRSVADAALFREALSALPFAELLANTVVVTVLDLLTRPVYYLMRPRWSGDST